MTGTAMLQTGLDTLQELALFGTDVFHTYTHARTDTHTYARTHTPQLVPIHANAAAHSHSEGRGSYKSSWYQVQRPQYLIPVPPNVELAAYRPKLLFQQ